MSITEKLAQAVSTPAVEVTADAVDDALAAAEFEGGLDARSCMQAGQASGGGGGNEHRYFDEQFA
jgi:hypothetical protein